MKGTVVSLVALIMVLSCVGVAQSASYNFPTSGWDTSSNPRLDASGNSWDLHSVAQWNSWAWSGVEMKWDGNFMMGGWYPPTNSWLSDWCWGGMARYMQNEQFMVTGYGNYCATALFTPATPGNFKWAGRMAVYTQDMPNANAVLKLVKWHTAVNPANVYDQTLLGTYPVTFTANAGEVTINDSAHEIAAGEILGIQFESTTSVGVTWAIGANDGDPLRVETVETTSGYNFPTSGYDTNPNPRLDAAGNSWDLHSVQPVSYTHLTLPTIYSV